MLCILVIGWGFNMSFDKAIEYNKEHRKKYRGAKEVDKSCRNHGSDDWSFEDRVHKNKKRQRVIDEKIQEVDAWLDGDYEDWDDDE